MAGPIPMLSEFGTHERLESSMAIRHNLLQDKDNSENNCCLGYEKGRFRRS